MSNHPVTPNEIEVRNHIQKAIGIFLDTRKDDQINLASGCARSDLAKQITTIVLQTLRSEYGKHA